LHASMNFGSRN